MTDEELWYIATAMCAASVVSERIADGEVGMPSGDKEMEANEQAAEELRSAAAWLSGIVDSYLADRAPGELEEVRRLRATLD